MSRDDILNLGLHNPIVHAVLQLEGTSWEQKMMLAIRALVLVSDDYQEKLLDSLYPICERKWAVDGRE
jgi:hypothetical protein